MGKLPPPPPRVNRGKLIIKNSYEEIEAIIYIADIKGVSFVKQILCTQIYLSSNKITLTANTIEDFEIGRRQIVETLDW